MPHTGLADRYRIERELGAGGMATVYLAEDLKHHRKVATRDANLPTANFRVAGYVADLHSRIGGRAAHSRCPVRKD